MNMSKTLNVYWGSDLVGSLEQNKHAQMTFCYSQEWLMNPQNIPLSRSLPLRSEAFRQKECRPFFAGLLPEEKQRQDIAKIFGVSANNDYALLDCIGGECAGAISCYAPDTSPQLQQSEYEPLSDGQLAGLLRELPRRPLLAGKDMRLSLAGAQDKVAVAEFNGSIFMPKGTSASTHIIKPAFEHFRGLVYNEFFCMKLAQVVGLKVAKV